MSEKEPIEEKPISVLKTDVSGNPGTEEAEVTRVNSKVSIHLASERKDEVDQEVEESTYYLSGKRLWLVHTGVLLSVFLVALDQSIVATALPKISSQFQALDQLTWIVTSFYLLQAGLMLFFGQVLTIVSSKWVFLFCIIIFEIGSLICGVAPSMNVLIFGRAIQGVGGSGGFIAILTIIAQIARLEIRPVLLGSFGVVFGFASVFGPLLGGAFTDKLTWRWCFYINLPFGAISLATVAIFLPLHPPLTSEVNEGKTLLQKWINLDWVGTIVSLGMTVSLLLPLTWGGVTKEWNDRVIIASFVLFGVLFIFLVFWERWLGKRAMILVDVFIRPTQIGASIATFCIMMLGTIMTYYIPFFYQAKGKSAVQSGIDLIPYMMAEVVGAVLSGYLNQSTGTYKPNLIVGPVIFAIASGLFFTIDQDTANPKIIGYQILVGFGNGVAQQQPLVAIQAEYAPTPDLIPQASSLVTYFQLLGAVVGMSIAGTVFGNQLSKNLAQYSLSPEIVNGVKQSVTAIFQLPASLQAVVVKAYISAIRYAFIIGVPAGGLTIIAGIFVKGWNLKKRESTATVAAGEA